MRIKLLTSIFIIHIFICANLVYGKPVKNPKTYNDLAMNFLHDSYNGSTVEMAKLNALQSIAASFIYQNKLKERKLKVDKK